MGWLVLALIVVFVSVCAWRAWVWLDREIASMRLDGLTDDPVGVGLQGVVDLYTR